MLNLLKGKSYSRMKMSSTKKEGNKKLKANKQKTKDCKKREMKRTWKGSENKITLNYLKAKSQLKDQIR